METPLILGGHSFATELGNEPIPDELTQRRIVETCMENGIRWFDTTYQPERIALGKALKALGLRKEATIIAWNFFLRPFLPDGNTRNPDPQVLDVHTREGLETMLEELQTDHIDCLIVHGVGDAVKDEAQQDLALRWQCEGLVTKIGCWYPEGDLEQQYGANNPYQLMVRPNTFGGQPETQEIFRAGKRLGWETLACSPFERGWKLDALVERAKATFHWNEAEARGKLSDLMLRFSLFSPDVDRLIVSMRRPDWIETNVESVKRGPLTLQEEELLSGLA